MDKEIEEQGKDEERETIAVEMKEVKKAKTEGGMASMRTTQINDYIAGVCSRCGRSSSNLVNGL